MEKSNKMQHVGFIFVFVFICIPCHVDCFDCLSFKGVLTQLPKEKDRAFNTEIILLVNIDEYYNQVISHLCES